MKCYYIHLIRHGITEGNLLGQYVGSTDMPLCYEGIKNLQNLSENFEYPRAEVFYISPLKRCSETLELLYPEVQPKIVESLKECDFGYFEGKNVTELKEDKIFKEWIENGGVDAPPNGESGADFQKRCCDAFEKIVEELMKSGITSSVIIAHGGTIMSIVTAFGLPQANFYDWMMGNGKGYTVRITPMLWMQQRKAEVINTLPLGDDRKIEGDQQQLIDFAREAANKAYEKNDEKI